MSEGKLVVWRCPVHGGQLTEGQRCRVVTDRTGGRITHCHLAEEVEVIPARSPNVLSRGEAELFARLLNDKEGRVTVLSRSLSIWAEKERPDGD